MTTTRLPMAKALAADASRFLTLRVGRDRGVADADAERVRQFARQLLGVK